MANDEGMFTAVEFKNFKALREARLPLGRVTVLIGPNGSGKSTVLQALELLRGVGGVQHSDFLSVGAPSDATITTRLDWLDPKGPRARLAQWTPMGGFHGDYLVQGEGLPSIPEDDPSKERLQFARESLRCFAFQAQELRAAVQLKPVQEMYPSGRGLAGVLDRMRDDHPERFAALNLRIPDWFPEFDQVLFETPKDGFRALRLRLAGADEAIPARHLSDGTMMALALLTLSSGARPPSLIALEEPEHGLHPRLLRQVKDSLYRLAWPEAHGDSRPPTQVLITTHSPYLLDEFSDHPEDIVICQKDARGVTFTPLQEMPQMEQILAESPRLGEVWYTGVLGGVPQEA